MPDTTDALATAARATAARATGDRRRRPTTMISRYWLRGRRRSGRRADERERIYVDAYSFDEWALALSIVALSACDLVLTQWHLAAGGAELNPLMAVTADAGPITFGVTKLGLTVLGALFLLVHVRFPLARVAMNALVGVYVGLMVWHALVAAAR